MIYNSWVDDNNEVWNYDGVRVILEGDDSEDAGYYADSAMDAYNLLVEYGYITAGIENDRREVTV